MSDRYIRKRREKNSSQTKSTDSVTEPIISTSSKTESEMFRAAIPKPSTAVNSVNELRAEFIESARISDNEFEYSDDTHNWLDESSEEYAHFLGSYE